MGDIEPGFLTILDESGCARGSLPDSTGRRRARPVADPADEPAEHARHRQSGLHITLGAVSCRLERLRQLGEKPSHPEMLDWLTERFVAGN